MALLTALFSLFLIVGCQAPEEAIGPLMPGTQNSPVVEEAIEEVEQDLEKKPGESSSEKKDASAKENENTQKNTPGEKTEKKSSSNEPTPKDETPAINVEQVTSNLQRAERALERNYKNILVRKPLGFDTTILSVLFQDTRDGWETLKLARQAIDTIAPLTLILGFLPLLCVLMFVILLTLLDRQFFNLAHNMQSKRYSRVSGSLTFGARLLVLLIGQMTSPFLLMVLSYFPIRAIFGENPWTILLTDTMWLMLAFRSSTALVEILLGLPWLDISDDHAKRLRSVLMRAAELTTIVFHLLNATRAFAPNSEIYALTVFIFQLTVATLPFALIRLRPSVLALFPDKTDSSLYVLLLRWFARNYYWILGLTVILLAMRAFGYVYASSFILSRGYGLLLLTMGLLFGAGKMRDMFDQRIKNLEDTDPQKELLQSIKRLITTATMITGAVIATKLLAIYSPIIMVLKTPLLVIQKVEFSLFNILSAAIIVGAATLVSKIVRALLNARVYPALGVEVGVAYAVNTIISYAIVVIGFFMVLVALGVNLSALTVVIASLSVGIGFGLQTLTENLISGFIILFGRAVRKGDYITVGNVYGRVEAVGARSVVVRTMDNYDLLIPSKDLVGGTIINWTYRDSIVRVHIPVGVTYNADPRVVERCLCEAATKHPLVLETPAPEVWFVGFGDSAINFELLLYYDCRKVMADRLKGELYYHIWDALEKEDIEIPFPQRDLHLRSANLDTLKDFLAHKNGQEPKREDD
jgi:small-conductance mechanosensitive channel